MSVEVCCPYCDWPRDIDPAAAGPDLTCWNCERPFVLLAPASAGPPAAAEPASRAGFRFPAAWVFAVLAVLAAGAAAGLARENARRGREVEAAQAAQAAAEELAREAAAEAAAAREAAAAARRDAERERDRAAAAAKAEAASRTAPEATPDAAPAVPHDIPEDVRQAALVSLRKAGRQIEPLFRRAVAENRALLPRLKAGRVVSRPDVRIPSDPARPVEFPSQKSKEEAIKACEARIAAGERAVRAWESDDLAFFAPDLTTPDARGAVGRIVGREVKVLRVPDKQSAVVSFVTESPAKASRPRKAEAVLTGIDAAKLAPGAVTEFKDVVVVAGSVEVGSATYPRLAVFSPPKP